MRFGAFNIYIPALLKPAAAELLLLLWALYAGRHQGIDLETLPARPQQGLTSVEAETSLPEAYWHAAGFQVAGARAVRIDMLERLSDLIRSRVTWRPGEGESAAPAPSGATGDGGFRVAPELMSVVGCSGEDFASILGALGFRCDRRKRPAADAAPTLAENVTGTMAAAGDGSDTVVVASPGFEEIWRPNRRKEARGRPDQAKGKQRGRKPRAERQQQREPSPRAERKQHIRTNDTSPFAVLAELRRNLAARRPEGS